MQKCFDAREEKVQKHRVKLSVSNISVSMLKHLEVSKTQLLRSLAIEF